MGCLLMSTVAVSINSDIIEPLLQFPDVLETTASRVMAIKFSPRAVLVINNKHSLRGVADRVLAVL